MGVIVSIFGPNKGRTDDPDPITGLTSNDKYLIQTSWTRIRADLTKNGVTLLLLLFERYPEDLELFPFKDVPVPELANNKKFQAHCSSVMYAFSSIVDSLQDPELLVNILHKIGDSHQRRTIPIKPFWDLNEVMLELFAKIMSKDEVQAWKKTLEVAFNVIVKQLKQ